MNLHEPDTTGYSSGFNQLTLMALEPGVETPDTLA